MENAGVVTFRDDYIFRQEVDIERYRRLGIVISHELSHHWFGDYTTMYWWNDTW